jgi:hypothetical protein
MNRRVLSKLLLRCAIPLHYVNFSPINVALQFLQLDYGASPELRLDLYHLEIVQTTLTRQIGARFQEVLDEAQCAFQNEIPPTNGLYKFCANKR